MEYIISDECLESIRRRCYEAGNRGQEVFTVRGPDCGELVRCRNCEHMYEMMGGYECERMSGQYYACEPDGFCSWAERRES